MHFGTLDGDDKNEAEKVCVNPEARKSDDPHILLDSLNTHAWEISSYQSSGTMGLVIVFTCQRCKLEWSSILTKASNVNLTVMR
jgi:hypothetical protein